MSYDLSGISILIVEDFEPVASLLQSVLKNLGCVYLYHAKNGEEGLRFYLEYKPDIVITDWDMEPIDGIQLTRYIRSLKKYQNPYTPILMTTGFSERNLIEDARDAGVTDFMAKPFTVDTIIRKISSIIEAQRDFVISDIYRGPDRRRRRASNKNNEIYDGPLRRANDFKTERLTHAH